MGKFWKQKSLKQRFGIFNGAVVMVVIALSLASTLYMMKTTSQDVLINNKLEQVKAFEENFDWGKYEEFSKNPSPNTTYWELVAELNKYREQANITYLYTLQVNNNGNVLYVIDGIDRASDTPNELGSSMPLPADLLQKIKGRESFASTMYTDPDYGELFTVFAPIKSKSGEFLGYVAMDMKASGIQDEILTAVKSSIPVALMASLIILIVVVMANGWYVKKH